MYLARWTLVVLAGCVLLLPTGTVQAQRPLPIQDRPTLSPWLNLYRRDPGPVGSYLSYVRPEQRLLSTLSRQRTGLARQEAALSRLQSELSQVGPETTIAPTGTGATFMNYSRYFDTRGSSAAGGSR